MGGAALIEVVIIIAGVAIVLVVATNLFTAWQKGRAAALATPCALFTPAVFPDECLGTCPAGVCTATATRRYFILWRQDAACACLPRAVAPAPPGGVAPPANP